MNVTAYRLQPLDRAHKHIYYHIMIRSFLILAIAILFATESRAQHLTLLPDSADFGDVLLDSTRDMTVIAINRSDSDITIAGGRIYQNNFQIVALDPFEAAFPPYVLAPGDSIVATIQFSPDSIGTFRASLTYSFGQGEVQQEYVLKGKGVSKQSAGIPAKLIGTRCRIQPNPAAFYIDVVMEHGPAVRGVVELRDLFGRVLHSSLSHETDNDGGEHIRLPCADFSSGTYVITESTAAGTAVLGLVAIVR